MKYEKDIDKTEFILELDSFTQRVIRLEENKLIDARSNDILNLILKNGLKDAYSNIHAQPIMYFLLRP